MKLYRKFLLGLASLISPFLWSQEGSLSGSLQDQGQETIPFATVAVMQLPDSTVVTGTTTEMDGSFIVDAPQKGEYLLRFSAIGFQSNFTEPFNISKTGFQKNFGTVIMKTAVTSLDEVMIKTWRPRVEVDNGKMVMRVEGTAIAAGNTAYQMLSRAPGVSVDQNGDFSINGKKGVAVMIDGRLSYLTGAELQTLLEGMPAENIKEIEVINNPSAKYDAEGAAGILNIKLKKNSLTGTNGAVYAGYKYRGMNLFNGGVNLNHKKGNWNSFLNLDLSELGYVRDQNISRIYAPEEGLKYFDQVGDDYRKRFVPSVQLGTDYDLNERHSVGAVVNFTYQDRTGDWKTSSNLRDAGNEPIGIIDARNYSTEDRGLGRINLHYTGELDTVGTTLSADMDYVRLEKEVDYKFTNFYTYPDDTPNRLEHLFSNSQSDYDIFSAKMDFSTPLSKSSNFSTGVKASKVISDSELKYYREENDSRVLDPSLSDKFKYEEEIYAAYITYSNRFNDTWNLNLGLRAEQTVGTGTSFSMGQENKKDYFKLFPNFSLEQNVSKNYKVNYSFSRRITRPDYERLNPVIFYLDPYTYAVGNPGLEPQINNSFQVSQTFFKKFHLLLSYDYAKNFMIEIPSTDPETLESSLSERNLDHMTTYGATLVAPFEVASFWNVNNNLVLNNQENELVIDGENIDNDNFFYMLQSNHQFALPADVKVELNATYRGPVAYGVYDIDKQWWLDLGVKKSFMNDKLNVSLNATDVFKTMDMHVTAEYTGNSFVLDQYFGNQAVSINLRYNFSKGSKTDNKSRKNSLEELNRAGGQ
jgi:iron complex outermembrane receptor protein